MKKLTVTLTNHKQLIYIDDVWDWDLNDGVSIRSKRDDSYTFFPYYNVFVVTVEVV